MPQRFKIWFFAVIFILPLLSASAQEYEIRLRQASKVGDKSRVSIVARDVREMSATADGKPVRSEMEDITVEFDGVGTVLEIDAKGGATKISVNVERLVKKEANATTEIAPKGATIVAHRDGKKKHYEINGKSADANAEKALEMVIPLSHGGPTDDEVLGTKEKKKVGDSWEINADLAKKDFEDGFGARVDELKGKVTFNGIAHRPDGDALKISAEMAIKVAPPFPPNLVLDKSAAEVRLAGEFPLDFDHQSMEGTMSMKMAIAAHGEAPNGGKLLLTVGAVRTIQQKTLPLK